MDEYWNTINILGNTIGRLTISMLCYEVDECEPQRIRTEKDIESIKQQMRTFIKMHRGKQV